MRLFVACNIAEETRKYFGEETDKLKRDLPRGVKWVKPGNYHITLKFLGDTSEKKTEELNDRLAEINLNGQFDCQFKGLSAFPARDYPRVLISRVTRGREELIKLHNKIEKAVTELGFAEEKRKFTPHLTLGRVKNKADIRMAADVLADEDFGKNLAVSDSISSFSLMKSILRSQGPVYQEIFSIDI